MVPIIGTPQMLSAVFPRTANMLFQAADHTQLQLYKAPPVKDIGQRKYARQLEPVARWRLGILFAVNAFNNVRSTNTDNPSIKETILGLGAGLFAGATGLVAGPKLVQHAYTVHESALYFNHFDWTSR